MFFVVTVRADKFEITEIIILSISVSMVNLKYFVLSISASFALRAPLSEQSDFKAFLIMYLIFWPTDLVLDSRTMDICTTPAARLFMKPSQNRLAAYEAGKFFSAKGPVTGVATKCAPSTFLEFNRSPVDFFTTNRAFCIRVSLM